MGGIWSRHNPWHHLIAVTVGLLLGLAGGSVLGALAALARNHLLTLHTRPAAVPAVLWAARGNVAVAGPFLMTLAVVTFLAIAGVYALWLGNTALFGEARFAGGGDIARAGAFRAEGAIIGRWGSRWMRADAEDNIMCQAPPRSGKGVSFVIPNLLMSPHSIVCVDLRGENYENSAKFREAELGHEIFVLDPLNANGETHCYNPLAFMERRKPELIIEQMQRLALQLMPYPLQGNPFFTDSARDGFAAVGCLLAAEPSQDLTLANIFAVLAGDPRKRLMAQVADLEKRLAAGERPIAPGAIDLMKSFCAHNDETYMNIRSTIQSRLGLFALPRVVLATRRSDFDVRELRSRRMTIYLRCAPDDFDILAPLFNLVFQQIVSLNSHDPFVRTTYGLYERLDEMGRRIERGGLGARTFIPEMRRAWAGRYREVARNSQRCLLILDEFKRLGKMDVLADAMSYMGGFGISMAPVVQAQSQLQEVYGAYAANTILTCCQTNIVMRPNTFRDAEDISKQLGSNGIVTRNRSTTRYNLFASAGNSSIGSTSEHLNQRPLLYPKEVTEMPRSKALIFKSGQHAILTRRVLYFKDRKLRRRAAMGGVALPIQPMEDYYAYMAAQRGSDPGIKDAGIAEDVAGTDVAFDFREECEQAFDDIDAGSGDFAPDKLPTTMEAMRALISEVDAAAYRRQLEADLARPRPAT
ncbi:MAG: type IV secretory system conjugative DNA transfer family protein [Sphingomonadales bacterium]|nr:type IV secretory system conjugative DNA transfer family protein [Sphingomonadales bacterium]